MVEEVTFTDTHAHIYLDDFKEDRADVLRKAKEVGVQKILMPNIDHTSIDNLLETEIRFPDQCIAMMGLHPCSVKKDFERELYIVEEWLAKRKFVAVGEIGTDLYWDKTFWGQQQEAFKIQVGFAKKYQLPIVIHCRESMDETIELLGPQLDGKLTGVFHCFTGTVAQATKIIEMGFMLGIGGVATFKKGGLDTVLPEINVNHLILETDCPYLAPTPFRGKRNLPEYIPLIAKRVSEIKNLPLSEVSNVTTKNAAILFKI